MEDPMEALEAQQAMMNGSARLAGTLRGWPRRHFLRGSFGGSRHRRSPERARGRHRRDGPIGDVEGTADTSQVRTRWRSSVNEEVYAIEAATAGRPAVDRPASVQRWLEDLTTATNGPSVAGGRMGSAG